MYCNVLYLYGYFYIIMSICTIHTDNAHVKIEVKTHAHCSSPSPVVICNKHGSLRHSLRNAHLHGSSCRLKFQVLERRTWVYLLVLQWIWILQSQCSYYIRVLHSVYCICNVQYYNTKQYMYEYIGISVHYIILICREYMCTVQIVH